MNNIRKVGSFVTLLSLAPLLSACQTTTANTTGVGVNGGIQIGNVIASINAGINSAYNALHIVAQKIDAGIALADTEIQPAAQALILVNDFAQSAISYGLIHTNGTSQSSQNTAKALAALNALAASPIITSAANGSMPNNPTVVAGDILATVAAVKSATSGKVNAITAVQTNGSAAVPAATSN